jgi:hypothetical protein
MIGEPTPMRSKEAEGEEAEGMREGRSKKEEG